MVGSLNNVSGSIGLVCAGVDWSIYVHSLVRALSL